MDSDGSSDLTMVATTAAVAANRKDPFGQEQREGEGKRQTGLIFVGYFWNIRRGAVWCAWIFIRW